MINGWDLFQKLYKEHQEFKEWSKRVLESIDREVEMREDYYKRLYTAFTAHEKAEEKIANTPFLYKK